METMYQRGKIQEESLLLRDQEARRQLPIVGVNTFLSKNDASDEHKGAELIRSTEEEKQDQVDAVRAFQARNADARPQRSSACRKSPHQAATCSPS